jgi:sirohydrochlorin cobaltochelatase
MTDLLIRRAQETLSGAPGDAPADLKRTAVFIAGHGTQRNKQSRGAIEDQVKRIQERGIFGEVHPTFMLEEPAIPDCWKATNLPNLVLVPFFMANGLHTLEDIPVMLGMDETEVRERLMRGDPTWVNPTSKGPQRLWYTPAIGTDSSLVDLVMQRVLEAEALPQPAGQG